MVKKARIPALAAVLVSISGLAVSPDFLGIFPEKVAALVSVLGIVLQAVTKSITDAE